MTMSLVEEIEYNKRKIEGIKNILKDREEDDSRRTPTQWGAKDYSDLTKVSNDDLMEMVHGLERETFGERKTDFREFFDEDYLKDSFVTFPFENN
jgi:hypothetical protein